MTRTWTLRRFRPADEHAVRALVQAAFGQRAEATLVERLRADGDAALEIVAVADGSPIGHVMASTMHFTPDAPVRVLGVAPLSVVPAEQGRGVGSALMDALVAAARSDGVAALFLLGDPVYYGRFGFRRATLPGDYGDTPAFQCLELAPGSLQSLADHRVHYARAFATLEDAESGPAR